MNLFYLPIEVNYNETDRYKDNNLLKGKDCIL